MGTIDAGSIISHLLKSERQSCHRAKEQSHLSCMLSVCPGSFVSVNCYRRDFAKHVYLCVQVYSKVYLKGYVG